MFGLACFLLTILFIAAIIFRHKFVSEAISFISGAPAKNQGLLNKVPGWAKLLAAEKLMNRFSKDSEPEKGDKKANEAKVEETVEPEFPPQREDVIIDIEPLNKDRLIGSGSGTDDKSGPRVLPPWEPGEGENSIQSTNDFDGLSETPEWGNENIPYSEPGMRNDPDYSLNVADNETQYLDNDPGEIPFNSEPENLATGNNFDDLLAQHHDPGKDAEREQTARKYEQVLNQVKGEDKKQNTPGGVDRPFKQDWAISNVGLENKIKAGERMNRVSRETPDVSETIEQIVEKPHLMQNDSLEEDNVQNKSQFDDLLAQYHDPEKEKERDMAAQRYLQILNKINQPKISEEERYKEDDLSSEEESLKERYYEIERSLK